MIGRKGFAVHLPREISLETHVEGRWEVGILATSKAIITSAS